MLRRAGRPRPTDSPRASRSRHLGVQLVGNTPLVEIRRVRDGIAPGVRLFGQLEGFNPGGSVKIGPALKMIQDGLARDPPAARRSSTDPRGTRIALRHGGRRLGYPVELVMRATVSVERKKVVGARAKAIYSDPLEAPTARSGCAGRSRRAPDRYFKPDQYNNAPTASPLRDHRSGIWRQTAGEVTTSWRASARVDNHGHRALPEGAERGGADRAAEPTTRSTD